MYNYSLIQDYHGKTNIINTKNHEKPTIFIVDDNKIYLKILEGTLKRKGSSLFLCRAVSNNPKDLLLSLPIQAQYTPWQITMSTSKASATTKTGALYFGLWVFYIRASSGFYGFRTGFLFVFLMGPSNHQAANISKLYFLAFDD